MPKKIFFLVLVMLFVIASSACSNEERNMISGSNSEVEKTTDIVTNSSNNTNSDGNETQIYSISTLNSSYSEDELRYSINYPQLAGLLDTDRQEQVNKIIKDEAIKVLKYYEDPFGSVEINIDYNITLETPSLLSIQYSGIGSVSNAAHPNKLFYTTNIDVEKGEKIRLADIINIDSIFIQKFLDGKFVAMWNEQGELIDLTTLSSARLQDGFTEADSLDNIGTEKQSDVYSYLTENSLGISISVPYAVGGHAEYEINYQDLKENIKDEKDIWDKLIE